ncbi:MAG: hypothetical protein JKY15_06015 [Deltaproteobacteria bacterium]|nr:hypothetical protein [Deltaproteobacteria bacterium]
MSNRIDRDGSSRLIERGLQIRAKETQKKQNTRFQQKLVGGNVKGAKAQESQLSKETLERYAKTEGQDETQGAESQDAEAKSPKLLQEQQQPKTQKKQDSKESTQGKKAETKKKNLALQSAVKNKQQQEQNSGEMGGRNQGDFFQQAVNMGLATQQAAATAQAHPVQIPDADLNAMVERISVGIDPSGNSNFIIDLKKGVLNGASIKVTAQGKNIRLSFSGLDASGKQSIKGASEKLRDSLSQKGLSLSNLELA